MTPRIRSDLFVSALTRRIFTTGAYAAVLRKGAEEAGAIFIRQRLRDGTERLYGPAPQSLHADEGRAALRLFELRAELVSADDIDARIAREIRFDPDCWIVEVEIDDRGDFFECVAQG